MFFSNAAALLVNEVHIVRQRREFGEKEQFGEYILGEFLEEYDVERGRRVGDGGNWRTLKAGCQGCQGWARGSVGRYPAWILW